MSALPGFLPAPTTSASAPNPRRRSTPLPLHVKQRYVTALFEMLHHRPELVGSEDTTYYQVMFESPDRVLFEIVYTDPK